MATHYSLQVDSSLEFHFNVFGPAPPEEYQDASPLVC